MLYLVTEDFRGDLKAVIQIQRFHTSERLASLHWAMKREETVFSLCICHSLHCHAFVFGDIRYIEEAGIVFLGLDLSALSSQEAVLVSSCIVLIKSCPSSCRTTGTCAVEAHHIVCTLWMCICMCVHVSQ